MMLSTAPIEPKTSSFVSPKIEKEISPFVICSTIEGPVSFNKRFIHEMFQLFDSLKTILISSKFLQQHIFVVHHSEGMFCSKIFYLLFNLLKKEEMFAPLYSLQRISESCLVSYFHF
jgi:hypothetical protein